jgi:signal peptidase I
MTSNLIIAAVLLAAGAAIGWLRWRLRLVTVFGESMRPTLAPGDRLLVRRIPLARVRTGDIVVIQHPERSNVLPEPPESSRWLIKRAVAVPGDPVPASVAPTLSIANRLGQHPATATGSIPLGSYLTVASFAVIILAQTQTA